MDIDTPIITPDYLIIVSCGSAKVDYKTQARHLYVGGLFTLALKYALTQVDEKQIRIMSAKHGLLKLDDLVEPYKLRMGRPGSIVADKVKSQARQQGIDLAPKVIVFGGLDYYNLCKEIWPHAIRITEGKRFGQIMKVYSDLIKEHNNVPLN
jgi:hypothetical protein